MACVCAYSHIRALMFALRPDACTHVRLCFFCWSKKTLYGLECREEDRRWVEWRIDENSQTEDEKSRVTMEWTRFRNMRGRDRTNLVSMCD